MVKKIIADAFGKLKDLIRSIFGSKEEEKEKPTEANKAELKVENENKDLNIKTSEDGNTATIEAKPGIDAKAIGNFALQAAKGAAHIVGQAVGMAANLGREVSASFKDWYDKRSGANNNLDKGTERNLEKEFTQEVVSRGMNSQKESGDNTAHNTNTSERQQEVVGRRSR